MAKRNHARPDNLSSGPTLSHRARWDLLGRRGAVVWFTGLSGAGKTTMAVALERSLLTQGRPAFVLDGDRTRTGLTEDLGFSPDDRRENVRRAAHVARLLAESGVIALAALISPFRADRAMARRIVEDDGSAIAFVEVHVSTPLEICERRDPKGLYARARAGDIPDFTGVSGPFETPLDADVVIDTSLLPLKASVRLLNEMVLSRVRKAAEPDTWSISEPAPSSLTTAED
jgi:bifunctional enzyme CysN/CysC